MTSLRTLWICLFALMSISTFCEGYESCALFAEMPEDKVYIQPDSIYFSPNQIYVQIAEDLIPIQHLSCDDKGVFVSIQDIQAGRGKQETWICPNEDCGYENYVGIDYCGICGTYRYARKRQNKTIN